MRRFILLAVTLLISLPVPAFPAESTTQRQWLHSLVEAMGWSYGLPDEPSDADYERILSGNRHFHFEAEDLVSTEDVVSVSIIHNFGHYSGSGWVQGIAVPTKAHFRFLLPRAGEYQLTAGLLLPGHTFHIGSRSFPANGGHRFEAVRIARLPLASGNQLIEDDLPPNGGIDYLELDAPPLPPVKPLQGWQPEKALTLGDLAVTSVRLLGLQSLLPVLGEKVVVEAEAAGDLGSASVTDVRFLGAASGGHWVRAGAEGTDLVLELVPPQAGVYRLEMRTLGDRPLTGTLDGEEAVSVTPGPAFGNQDAGTFYLAEGVHQLRIHLPPRAGVDRVTLSRLASDQADYRRLCGLPQGDFAPTPAQLDKLLKLLAAIGSPG